MSSSFKQAMVLLGCLAAVVLALVWFWHTFEKVRDQTWTGFHGEARRNDTLAAERLLKRLGLRTRAVENLHSLGELPPTAGTVFLPVWRATMSSERSAGLLGWVEEGGHLIVVGRLGYERETARRRDELLGPLGVEVLMPPEPVEEDEDEEEQTSSAGIFEGSDLPNEESTAPANAEGGAPVTGEGDGSATGESNAPANTDGESAATDGEDPGDVLAGESAEGTDVVPAPVASTPACPEPDEETPQQRRRRRSRETLDDLLDSVLQLDRQALPGPVPVPGRISPLQVTYERDEAEWELKDRSGKAVWAVPGEREYRILQYEVGRGLVTVLNGMSFLRNHHIGSHDNAELVWRLATWGGRRGETWVVFGYEVPSLLARIAAAGWMVLISLGAWLLAWLVRHAQRFGPLHPLPTPPRRSVIEHVDASGRFLWRHGHGHHLLVNLRDALWRRAAMRTPEWGRLDELGRVDRVAELSGLEPTAVRTALAVYAQANRTQFLETVQRLERILRTL